jgi:ACS family pantothenate transporter-like MFS transporter
MWNNVVNAWWPLVFYPATDAPRFHMGMIAMIFVCIATLGVTWLVWFWERREWRSQIRSETEDKERSVTHEQGAPEGSA